jgi:flagellar hook-length control protein FliK
MTPFETTLNVASSADRAPKRESGRTADNAGGFSDLLGNHVEELDSRPRAGEQSARGGDPCRSNGCKKSDESDPSSNTADARSADAAAEGEQNETKEPENEELVMPPFESPMTNGLGNAPRNIRSQKDTDVPDEMALNAGELLQQTIFNEPDTPAEQALNGNELSQQPTLTDLQATHAVNFTAIQALQNQKPSVGREKSPAELVLAALGEHEGLGLNKVSNSATAQPDAMPSLNLVNERVMHVEQLSSRFGEQLLSMVQQNEKVMKITVQPAALGQLTVLVREENASMTVEIHSQSEAVRELIARQEDSIRRLMQEHDVDLGKFDVLLSDKDDARDQHLTAKEREAEGRSGGIEPASEESEELHETQHVLKNRAGSWVA